MLLLIAGPSGAGKTHLIQLLSATAGFTPAIAHTTRPPRVSERADVDFHFVDTIGFLALAREGRLEDWDFLLDHHYGYARGELDKADDVAAAVVARMVPRLKVNRPHARFVFVDAPDEIRAERTASRMPDCAQRALRRRLDLEERTYAQNCDLLVNEELMGDQESLLAAVDALR